MLRYCIQTKKEPSNDGSFFVVATTVSRPDNRSDCVRERVAPALSLDLLHHFLNTFAKQQHSTMRQFADANQVVAASKRETQPLWLGFFFWV